MRCHSLLRPTRIRSLHTTAIQMALAIGISALLAGCDGVPSEPASLRSARGLSSEVAATGPTIILSGLVAKSLTQITADSGAAAAAAWSGQMDALKLAIRAAMLASNTPLADQKRAELKAVNLACVLDGLGGGIVATEMQNVQAVMAGVNAALLKGGASATDAARAKGYLAGAASLVPGVGPRLEAGDLSGALDVATQAGAMADAARALVGVADPATVTATPPVYTGSGQFPIEQPTPWAYQPTYPSQSACGGLGTTYDVGPGLAMTKLSDVPWLGLKPCDNVRIHYSPTPYREVVQLGKRGAANQWIRVTGVAGPNGELPILDGHDAVVPASLSFSNPIFEIIGMVLVLPPSGAPWGYKPGYIEISNLEIRNASMRNKVTSRAGQTVSWDPFASGIYIERAEHVTIRNCHLHDNGNGLFQNSKYDEAAQSRDLLVEGNDFHDNGNPGSAHEHNAYTEGVGTVYQYNHFGPLMAGALGDNIKERSVGLTIRYNFIDGATHLLILEDPESNYDWEMVQRDAWGSLMIRSVYIYGNEMRMRNPSWGTLPWGITGLELGDARAVGGRQGTVYFYNNTVVSQQDGNGYGTPTTYLFAFRGTPQLSVYARNNSFLALPAVSGGKARPFAVFYHYGAGDFASNWMSAGWFPADPQQHNPGSILHMGAKWDGTGWGVNTVSASLNPGYANVAGGDFHLVSGSPLIGAGGALDPEIVKTGNLPTLEYAGQGHSKVRSSMTDVGAYGH